MEMFLRYAQTYGGNSAAAHALMSAELARQSLGPTRVLSDGSSLPASFEGIRELHRQQRSETALSPDIQNAHLAHTGATSRFGSNPSRPLDRPADPPSPIRREVQQRASEIQGTTAAKGGEFDNKAGIVKTEDGTLESKKSLLGQSIKQIRNDASTTAQEVTDAAKDLFNRK